LLDQELAICGDLRSRAKEKKRGRTTVEGGMRIRMEEL
jgi:hypothetical protein